MKSVSGGAVWRLRFFLTEAVSYVIFKVHFLRPVTAGLNQIGTFFGNDSFPKSRSVKIKTEWRDAFGGGGFLKFSEIVVDFLM